MIPFPNPIAIERLIDGALDEDLGRAGDVTTRACVPASAIAHATIGARQAGVDAFLVPAGDNAREARRYAKGLRIIPVKSFQQALQALATLRES